MVIALAGRRIDKPGEKEIRFPLENVPLVKDRIKDLFVRLKPKVLVCSAACGADLLALETAGELNIPRSIVLPFDINAFKRKSVTDRPGLWGSLFDGVQQQVREEEGLIVMKYGSEKNEEDAYRKTNDDILNLAEFIAGKMGDHNDNVAVVVWENKPKLEDDITAHFLNLARQRNFPTEIINTINN